MDKASQKDAIEALHDWSRWGIGIGFTAGAGCVVIFLDAAAGLARTLLVLAIGAFALAVLAAFFLGHALARTLERLPLSGARGEPGSIADHRIGGPFSIGGLARAQLGFMVLGGLLFLGWVVLLPP